MGSGCGRSKRAVGYAPAGGFPESAAATSPSAGQEQKLPASGADRVEAFNASDGDGEDTVPPPTGDAEHSQERMVLRGSPTSCGTGSPATPKRMYSIRSENAFSELVQLEDRLQRIEKRLGVLEDMVERGPPEAVGAAKTELAHLEADAHKLESNGVDNVYTSELNSGRQPAKEWKKGQLQRLEALFERIDAIFATIAAKK